MTAHRCALTVDMRRRWRRFASAACDDCDWFVVVWFVRRADCIAAYRRVRDAAAEHQRAANEGLIATSHHQERRKPS